MASKADLQAYFKLKAATSEGPVAKKQIENPEKIQLRTLAEQKLKLL